MDILPKQKRGVKVHYIQDGPITAGLWGYKGGNKAKQQDNL